MATATLEDTLDKLNSSLDRIANVLSGSNKKNQETRKDMVSRFKGTFQDDPITRLAKAIESNQSISPTKLSGTNVEGEKEGNSFLTKLLGGLILASGIGIAIREFLQTEEGQKLKKILGTYFDEIIKPIFGKVGSAVLDAALDAGKAVVLSIGKSISDVGDSIRKSIRQGISDGFDAAKAYIDNLFNKLTPGLADMPSEEISEISSTTVATTAMAAANAARQAARQGVLNRANPNIPSINEPKAPQFKMSERMQRKYKFAKPAKPPIDKTSQNNKISNTSTESAKTNNTELKKEENKIKKNLKKLKIKKAPGLPLVGAVLEGMGIYSDLDTLQKQYDKIVASKAYQDFGKDSDEQNAIDNAFKYQKKKILYGDTTRVGLSTIVGAITGAVGTLAGGGIFSGVTGPAAAAVGYLGTSAAVDKLIDMMSDPEKSQDLDQLFKQQLNPGDSSSIIPEPNSSPQNYSAVNQESMQIAALTENAGGGSGGGNITKIDNTKVDNNNQVISNKNKSTDRQESFNTYLATYA